MKTATTRRFAALIACATAAVSFAACGPRYGGVNPRTPQAPPSAVPQNPGQQQEQGGEAGAGRAPQDAARASALRA